MARNKKTKEVALPLFERLERFIQDHDWFIFWAILALATGLGLALYDPRVSLAGDDSTYILAARSFIKEFTFPGFQGPLYPIVLSVVVAIFGISLTPLKLFSLLALLGFMFMTFITFRKRIPSLLLMPVLLLTSITAEVLYFGSQTYSEAFYMFMQSLVIFVFFRYFIDHKGQDTGLPSQVKQHAWLALALLGALLTRSVGFALIIAVLGYFLCNGQWKNLGLSAGCVLVVFLIYSGLKAALWPESGFQLSGQGSDLLLKNYYKPELGKEDLSGFINRLLQNSNQYLSNAFPRIMGFGVEKLDNSVPLTIGVYLLALVGLGFSYKKNKYIFFSGLMTGCFLLVTFVILQVAWNQERLIIPQYPFMLLLLLAALYYLLSTNKLKMFRLLYLIPVIWMVYISATDMSRRVTETQKITDVYSGLTPDWVHYVKISEWASKNLGENDKVACRKPNISSIYGNGKAFHGIYSIPTVDKNEFMATCEANPDGLIAIQMNNTYKLNVHMEHVTPAYMAHVRLNTDNYVIAKASDSLKEILAASGMSYISYPQFKALVDAAPDMISIYNADVLLTSLKEAGVTHMMSAQLRIHPNVKDGQYIDTAERYGFYIEEKYPGMFEVIHQEGADDDEPARILRINWEMYP